MRLPSSARQGAPQRSVLQPGAAQLGWVDASRERFEDALVPWSILAEREVTDPAVQEALLAVPYAYGKLGVYSTAALKYETALKAFGGEIDKLGASITSIRQGTFLKGCCGRN